MKRIAIWALAGLLAVTFVVPAAASDNRQDLKVIKRAIRENPDYRAGREATRFNLEIKERGFHRDKLRLTVPLALFDLFFLCADNERVRLDDCEVDVRALYEELRKAGPGVLLELQGNHGSLKVWLD